MYIANFYKETIYKVKIRILQIVSPNDFTSLEYIESLKFIAVKSIYMNFHLIFFILFYILSYSDLFLKHSLTNQYNHAH